MKPQSKRIIFRCLCKRGKERPTVRELI